MSIESITEKIRSEAQSYSDDRKAQAEATKKSMLNKAYQQAEELKAGLMADAKRDSKILKERRLSVAELDCRKLQLSAKQEVINESYEAALEKFVNLPEDVYMNFLKVQLEEYRTEGGEVLLNSHDQEKYGNELQKFFEGSRLVLSDEVAEISGGCILRRGKISYNASIEKLLDNVKTELMADVANILFQ